LRKSRKEKGKEIPEVKPSLTNRYVLITKKKDSALAKEEGKKKDGSAQNENVEITTQDRIQGILFVKERASIALVKGERRGKKRRGSTAGLHAKSEGRWVRNSLAIHHPTG